MSNLYVIVEYPDSCMVLGLQARTEADCKSAISWQRAGQFKEPMHICCYDEDLQVFVSEDGWAFRPGRSAFTEKAWGEFNSRHPLSEGPYKELRNPPRP